MGPRPTIVDVARTAGVAVGTASNALSGKGRVSAATRALVIKVADDLSFVPQRAARGLPTGRTMSIGLRFGHDATVPAGDFFLALLDSAARHADASGYGLMIRRSEGAEYDSVDGLIIVDPTDADERNGAASGLPVVTVGRTRKRSLPWVDVDHEAALTTLVEHLELAAGRGPAWFVRLPQSLGFVDALESSFRMWLRRSSRPGEVLHGPDDARAIADLMPAWLADHDVPALIVTTLDAQAVGVQFGLGQAGLALPLGSASDGQALALISPAVSGMALDGASHGREAVAMVLEWLQTGSPPANRLLPARLVSR